MSNELDIRQDLTYDIMVNRNRTLNQSLQAFFVSGDTEYNFDLSVYSGATLEVKKDFNSSITLLSFTTVDNSIELQSDGIFKLIKTADELNKLRAGQYKYDMYLSSESTPKRAFLSGDFILYDYITK